MCDSCIQHYVWQLWQLHTTLCDRWLTSPSPDTATPPPDWGTACWCAGGSAADTFTRGERTLVLSSVITYLSKKALLHLLRNHGQVEDHWGACPRRAGVQRDGGDGELRVPGGGAGEPRHRGHHHAQLEALPRGHGVLHHQVRAGRGAASLIVSSLISAEA